MSPFANEFADLCQEEIVWRQLLSRLPDGTPVYADPVVFSPFTSPGLGGRRVSDTIRVTAPGGATPGGAAVVFMQVSIIYLLAVPPMKNSDLVYVVGDVEPYPPILGIKQPTDETGLKVYTRITLGANG